GNVRLGALEATSPALRDVVVAGHDQQYIGLLAWPDLDALRRLCAHAPPRDPEALLAAAQVVAHIQRGLAAYNARNSGSSLAIRRVLLLSEPPSIDGDEITDKGYINQRAVLDKRRALVARLYADPAPPEVIVVA